MKNNSALNYKFTKESLQTLIKFIRNYRLLLILTGADGDIKPDNFDVSTFQYPDCSNCGGILKPDAVFFWESVPRERTEMAISVSSVLPGLADLLVE